MGALSRGYGIIVIHHLCIYHLLFTIAVHYINFYNIIIVDANLITSLVIRGLKIE